MSRESCPHSSVIVYFPLLVRNYDFSPSFSLFIYLSLSLPEIIVWDITRFHFWSLFLVSCWSKFIILILTYCVRLNRLQMELSILQVHVVCGLNLRFTPVSRINRTQLKQVWLLAPQFRVLMYYVFNCICTCIFVSVHSEIYIIFMYIYL